MWILLGESAIIEHASSTTRYTIARLTEEGQEKKGEEEEEEEVIELFSTSTLALLVDFF